MKEKFRTTAILVMILAVMMIMTGCIELELGVKINEDETGSLIGVIAYHEDFINYVRENGGEDPLEGENAKLEEIDGENYYVIRKETETISFDELEQTLMSQLPEELFRPFSEGEETGEEEFTPLFESVKIEKTIKDNVSTFVFEAVTSKQEIPEETDEEIDIELPPFNQIFRFSITVQMPGEIKEVEGGEQGGNAVTFEIKDFTSSHTIRIVSVVEEETNVIGDNEDKDKDNDDSLTRYLLAGGIVGLCLVGMVVVIIRIRRKKSSYNSDFTDYSRYNY
jgi:hypothetical protein